MDGIQDCPRFQDEILNIVEQIETEFVSLSYLEQVANYIRRS